MNLLEAMAARHSVRRYLNIPLKPVLRQKIETEIQAVNRESGLHIQAVFDEPQAFSSRLARYGRFSGVANYLVLIGKDEPDFEEKCGYYGEKLALFLQQLGLNSCWVGLTYKKIPGTYSLEKGEKICCVIAFGYGENQGVSHKSKSIETLSDYDGSQPAWFRQGVEAAMLAPTALNQQKFRFLYQDGKVKAQKGTGFYTKTDLGIARYHFELGAAPHPVHWA